MNGDRCCKCGAVIHYTMEGRCPVCYWAAEIQRKADDNTNT